MLEFLRRKKGENFYTAPPDGEADVFVKEAVPLESLPEAARDPMGEGRPPDDARAFTVRGPMGLATYVVLKTWNAEGGGAPSRRAYAVDVVEGKRVGDTSFNVFGNELASTHMGTTARGFERRGLGERRIILLNDIVEEAWGTTLPSAPNVSASGGGEGLWKKLVKRQLATATRVYGSTRYEFIPTDERIKTV